MVETLLVPVILDADLSPMRTAISSLRRKLGDYGKDSTYMFTEHSVGYRMPRGETKEGETKRESPRHHRDNSEGSNLSAAIQIHPFVGTALPMR